MIPISPALASKLIAAGLVAAVAMSAGYKLGHWRGAAGMEDRAEKAEEQRQLAQTQYDTLKRHVDAEILRRNQEAQAAMAEQLHREARNLAAIQAAQKELDDEREKNRAAAARAAGAERDAVELRKRLALYTAGGTTGAADTLPACQQRAAAAGDILATCVQIFRRTAGELATAAEDRAAELRGMQRAWPR